MTKLWVKVILLFFTFNVVMAAPIIPEGNGLISVAVFENPQGEKVFLQISDDQYARMGSEKGVVSNPQDHDGLKYTGSSYQYPKESYIPVFTLQSATSSEVRNPQEDFKDIDSRQSLYNVLIPTVEASISFDNSNGDTSTTGTSQTTSFVITGFDTAIVVGVSHSTAADISSVTYAGDSLTQIHSNIVGEGSARVDLWLRVGTATGDNNVVITMSGSDTFRSMFLSYAGVADGGSTGGSDSSANLSWAADSGDQILTTTIINDDARATFYGRTQSAYGEGTNVTYIQTVSDVVFIGDNGSGISPPGSFSQTFTNSISNTGAIVGVVLAPLAAGGYNNSQIW